jgi:hypothetical protein
VSLFSAGRRLADAGNLTLGNRTQGIVTALNPPYALRENERVPSACARSEMKRAVEIWMLDVLRL